MCTINATAEYGVSLYSNFRSKVPVLPNLNKRLKMKNISRRCGLDKVATNSSGNYVIATDNILFSIIYMYVMSITITLYTGNIFSS